MNDIMKKSLRWLRRIVVALIGTLILLAGIAMIFMPGPGMVIIPAGLAVLCY